MVAVIAIAGLGLALTACGGGDDDAAPAATAADGTTAGTDAGNNTGDNSGTTDTIKVNSINDIPQKCVDLMGDFLKKIEPIVKDIDWKNAKISDMQGVSDQLDAETSSIDDQMTSSGCDKYQLDDSASMDAIIQLAKDKAPGTVAYFEFIKNLSASDLSSADLSAGGSNTGGDAGASDTGAATDVPQDCDGAINYIKGLMDKYQSMQDLNVSQLQTISKVTSVITTKCSVTQMNQFLTDPKVTSWMSG
jgi:hypothetical protein